MPFSRAFTKREMQMASLKILIRPDNSISYDKKQSLN